MCLLDCAEKIDVDSQTVEIVIQAESGVTASKLVVVDYTREIAWQNGSHCNILVGVAKKVRVKILGLELKSITNFSINIVYGLGSLPIRRSKNNQVGHHNEIKLFYYIELSLFFMFPLKKAFNFALLKQFHPPICSIQIILSYPKITPCNFVGAVIIDIHNHHWGDRLARPSMVTPSFPQ